MFCFVYFIQKCVNQHNINKCILPNPGDFRLKVKMPWTARPRQNAASLRSCKHPVFLTPGGGVDPPGPREGEA